MSSPRPIRKSPRWLAGAINIIAVAGLLYLATFLPPDTSLDVMRGGGTLRVCVPQSAPPLVTGDASAPGYDIEVLEHLAEQLNVRLHLNYNPAIGQDFNPRNWRLTRAQCSIVAGGVIDSTATRGFLQLLATGITSGWAAIVPDDAPLHPAEAVAVLPSQGLDRLALSGFLREKGIRAVPARSPENLAAALEAGTADMAIADRFTIGAVPVEEMDIRIIWLPEPPFTRLPLAFGLWKGDLTLMRALRDGMAELERNGTLQTIAERYGLDVEPEASDDMAVLFSLAPEVRTP